MESLDDEFGVSNDAIFGIDKNTFNSEEKEYLVVDTIAEKHKEETPLPPAESKTEDEKKPAETTEKRKRGRPSKADSAAKQPKKEPFVKKIDVDSLPEEVFDYVLENYSKKPATEIATHLKVSEKIVHRVAEHLKKYFETAISAGDIDEKKTKELFVLLTEYEPPKVSNIDTFAQKILNKYK